MKWTMFLIASIMLLFACALAQPGQYYDNSAGQLSVGDQGGDQGGAPTPSTPNSAEALGLQVPSTVATSQENPSAQEKSGQVVQASQQLAYAASPGLGAVSATGPTYKLVVPPGGYASNKLYISYAPQTVASCYLYAYLPLWLQTSTYGNIWFYEWYPNGMLDTNYAGRVYYPGWYKRWFYADVPGWHILQYYCNGWSNYVYIYVNTYGGYMNPSPYQGQQPPYPYPYGTNYGSNYGSNQMTNTYPYTSYSSYSSSMGLGSSMGSSYSY